MGEKIYGGQSCKSRSGGLDLKRRGYQMVIEELFEVLISWRLDGGGLDSDGNLGMRLGSLR